MGYADKVGSTALSYVGLYLSGMESWPPRFGCPNKLGSTARVLPYALLFRGGGKAMDTLPKRKCIRLAPEVYTNPHEIFFLTIDADERRQHFTEPEFNDSVIAKLRELATQKQCPIKIYCLMPTHLHLLISAGNISVIEWVARFKQYSQHMARQRGIAQLWQRSFYDHRVRPKENIADTIEYIRANPVRAGLVNHPDDWRWTGSVEL